MINTQTSVEGKSHSFNFTVKDTQANEVMMEVFNAITELAQAGAENIKVTVEKV